MIYQLKTSGLETEIELKGRLTFADYATFKEITQIFKNHGTRKCLLNLSELEFIDSAGLGMLLIAREKMLAKEGRIILKGANGQVKKILNLAHLDTLFELA